MRTQQNRIFRPYYGRLLLNSNISNFGIVIEHFFQVFDHVSAIYTFVSSLLNLEAIKLKKLYRLYIAEYIAI